MKKSKLISATIARNLFKQTTQLIESRKKNVFVAINTELVQLYRAIGKLLKAEALGHKRAEYGEALIENLSMQLKKSMQGVGQKDYLWNCVRTADIIELDSFRILAGKKIKLQREFNCN